MSMADRGEPIRVPGIRFERHLPGPI